MIGCTFKELAYRNADYFIVSRLDEAFDLPSAQKRAVKKQVEELLRWHREVELPFYVVTLNELLLKLEDGLIEPEIAWVYTKFNEVRNRALTKVYGNSLEFFEGLSKEQILYFQKYQEKNNKKRFEDLLKLNDEEFTSETYKKTIANLEEWIGDLTAKQKAEARGFAKKWRPLAYEKYEDSLKKQTAFLNLLFGYVEKRRTSSPGLEQQLWELTAPMLPNENASARLRKELYTEIAQSMSASQIQEFKESVLDWRNAFVTVMSE